MDERYENDYENTANQWEETDEGGRVTYRERSPYSYDDQADEPRRRTAQHRAYEPAGAREYRADSRPGRTRAPRTAASQAASGAGETAGSYVQPIMLLAVALLAVLSIITGIVSCATSGGDAQPANTATSGEAAVNTAAANVEAAEKTTDSDGIVHGTTEDGTNFTITYADSGTATAAAATAAADDAASDASADAADDAESQSAEGEDAAAAENGAAAAAQKVSFAAVGDQLASDNALQLADSYAGEVGDGTYDFKPFYQEVKPFLQQHSLRYINQESPLIGGQENYEVSGYPNFISPEACADAIADVGFNLVNFDSNHSYDAGVEGIEYSQKVWAKHPGIVVAGSYADQASRETVHMVESNGIRFAFLAYSYGDNSYEDVSKEPNNYYAVPFVKDDAAADIARAKKVADAVIVSMHWGTEYSAEPNDDQKDWAQWLADQDVDLVIGTHAHNIQPVQYFTGSAGNKVPVVFGLGDFVSGWTITDTILSGIFTCDFVRQDTGRVSVENPQWHPTIEWSDGTGQTYVRMLENMSVEQINANTRTEDVPDSFRHVYDTTNSIIAQIPVEWGSDAADKAEKAASDSSSATEGSSSATGTDSNGTASANGSSSSSATAKHVDEDEDGYDDNTDEWIGFGDDADSDSTDGASDGTGYVDEDEDGYDDNTDEWIGFGDDDAYYAEDDGDTANDAGSADDADDEDYYYAEEDEDE